MSTLASTLMSSVPVAAPRHVYYQVFIMPQTRKVGVRLWSAQTNECIFAVRIEQLPGKTLAAMQAALQHQAGALKDDEAVSAFCSKILDCNVEGKDPVVVADPEFIAGRIANWGTPRSNRQTGAPSSRSGEASALSW